MNGGGKLSANIVSSGATCGYRIQPSNSSGFWCHNAFCVEDVLLFKVFVFLHCGLAHKFLRLHMVLDYVISNMHVFVQSTGLFYS